MKEESCSFNEQNGQINELYLIPINSYVTVSHCFHSAECIHVMIRHCNVLGKFTCRTNCLEHSESTR